MHVNDLPDDVLALVFRAVLPAIKRHPADVRSGLALLSVCRRWREVALPMVYDTVVVNCDTEGTDGPETVDIKTSLDLVVDAKCLHMVRQVVIDVFYRTSPLQGLEAVIERMRGAVGELTGVRKLYLSLRASGSGNHEPNLPAADLKYEIASVSSALAALMPGLREIKFDAPPRIPVVQLLFGQLAGFYADQLQVLHSTISLVVPHDRVFARLRDVMIKCVFDEPLESQLPRLDPEVVESLVLRGLIANDMWSMFCADSDGCAITFPRLVNLDLEYRPRFMMSSEQLSNECPWAPHFPAVKHVQITCFDDECPSMENAVFPDRLESLDLTACSGMLLIISGRKVHVSQNLALSVMYEHNASNRSIDIANHMLAESNCYNMRKLVIFSMYAIPLGLITYTGLTHLKLNGSTTADDVMELIRRQRHLVSLRVDCLNLADTQTDFSIPECTEHEPMTPLDTQIKYLALLCTEQDELPGLALSMLKYLLLRIPTLTSVTTAIVSREQILAFIDEYIQWYPHLASIERAM